MGAVSVLVVELLDLLHSFDLALVGLDHLAGIVAFWVDSQPVPFFAEVNCQKRNLMSCVAEIAVLMSTATSSALQKVLMD